MLISVFVIDLVLAQFSLYFHAYFSRLGYVRVRDCPRGLEPLAGACKRIKYRLCKINKKHVVVKLTKAKKKCA